MATDAGDLIPRGARWTERWWRVPGEMLLVRQGTSEQPFAARLAWVQHGELGIEVDLHARRSLEMIFIDETLVRNDGVPDEIISAIGANLDRRLEHIEDPTRTPILVEMTSRFCEESWVDGKSLRRALTLDLVEFDRQIKRLVPRYLARTEDETGDRFAITLPTLLLFEEALKLHVSCEQIFKAVARRYNADHRSTTLSFDDLAEVGAHIEPASPHNVALLDRIALTAQLTVGGAALTGGLLMPQDREEIAAAFGRGMSFRSYLTHAANEAHRHGHHFVKRPWITAPLWLHRDGTSTDFRFEEPVRRVHNDPPTVRSIATADFSDDPRFAVLGPLGEGRFAEVFRGTDTILRREIAIKFVRPDAVAANAIEHARALARVQHPNIVCVYDVVELVHPVTRHRSQAVVMELVEGITMTERLGLTMAPAQLLAIGNALIDGIEAYHRSGRAHLDLHEANIVVSDGLVKILDPLYFDTTVLSSTATRESQQARDLRGIRDVLVQALALAVGIEAVSRFERETARPTLESLRTSLRNAIGTP